MDGKSFPGSYIYKIFANAGLHHGNHQIVRDNFDKAVALVLADASSRGRCYLSALVDIFKLIFGPEAVSITPTRTHTHYPPPFSHLVNL